MLWQTDKNKTRTTNTWHGCPGNAESTDLFRSEDSLPLVLLKAGEVWIPAGRLPHCFGIADPIIRLSFSPASHPIVGGTWPSQLPTRGLRMITCCCTDPAATSPHISLPKSVPLLAVKAVTNFSLFTRSSQQKFEAVLNSIDHIRVPVSWTYGARESYLYSGIHSRLKPADVSQE